MQQVGYPINLKSCKHENFEQDIWFDWVDVDYYANTVRGTGTKAYIEIFPRQIEPEEYRVRAIDIYKKGADGICLWDTYSRVVNPHRWSMAQRLGHKEELVYWNNGEGDKFRTLPIISLGGIRVDKYPPNQWF